MAVQRRPCLGHCSVDAYLLEVAHPVTRATWRPGSGFWSA